MKRWAAALLPAGLLRTVVGTVVLVSFLLRLVENRSIVVDYDDGVYWQTAMAIGAGGETYTEVFHAQPPLFAWLLAQPFVLERRFEAAGLFFPHAEFVARIEMVAFAAVLVAAAAGIATILRGPLTGMLAALITCWVPLLQLYSFQFGADLPAAALATASLYFALRARIAPRKGRYWAAAGAMLCLAAMLKFIAVLTVPSIALAMLTSTAATTLANPPGWWRRTGLALTGTFLGFAATTAAALLLLRPPPAAWGQVILFHMQASVDLEYRDFAELLEALGPWAPGFFYTSLACAVLCLFRRDLKVWGGVVPIALWALAIVPFVLYYKPVFKHHGLLFVAPGAIVIALAVSGLFAMLRVHWRIAGSVTVLAASVFAGWLAVNTPLGSPPRYAAVESCLRTLPRDYEIASDDQEMVARAGLRTPSWLVDTSHVRLDTGWLSDEEIIIAAKASNGILFARAKRLGDRPAVKAWAAQRFPVRYDANGYRFYVASREVLRGCLGRIREADPPRRGEPWPSISGVPTILW